MKRDKALSPLNTHHHTKTCHKKGPGCRFGIPRPPSEFTIIAQAMAEEVKEVEVSTVSSLEYIMRKVKSELKSIEDDLIERQHGGNANAEIEGSLTSMLSKLIPNIRILGKLFQIFRKASFPLSGSNIVPSRF